MKRIALEEHFLAPGFEEYWLKTVEDVDPSLYAQVLARLNATPASLATLPAIRQRSVPSALDGKQWTTQRSGAITPASRPSLHPPTPHT